MHIMGECLGVSKYDMQTYKYFAFSLILLLVISIPLYFPPHHVMATEVLVLLIALYLIGFLSGMIIARISPDENKAVDETLV